MKKLFYYFLIATLAFNFVGCSDKDKDLEDVLNDLEDKYGDDDEDWETVEIGDCTYEIAPKTQEAHLLFGFKMSETTLTGTPTRTVKGDFIVPQTIIYKSKTYTVTTVLASAFLRCYDLTSLTFPDEIEYIQHGQIPLFDDERSFKMTIGKGIKIIGLQNLTKNTTLIIYATTPPEPDIEDDNHLKQGFIGMVTNKKLYVPKESMEAYKAHDVWKHCTIGSIDDELED